MNIITIVLTIILSIIPTTTTWHDGYQPCREEDGSEQTTCYWDATTRGNHKGLSYIIKDGSTHYIN